MNRNYSHLNSAVQIVNKYKGQEPFALFLKIFYSQHKKYGSKDRKQISHLCYCYFRLGKSAPSIPAGEKILMGLFLCSRESNEILAKLKPEWNDKYFLSPEEKCSMINDQFSPKESLRTMLSVFPWKNELSEGMEYEEFCKSFLIQPDLFIRIRPHHAEPVLLKLDATGVNYEVIAPFTVRLPNSFKVERFFNIDVEVVIQDYSSHQIINFLPVDHGRPVRVWDCCAASGGKSIMAYDVNPNIELTVSDIRESILINLKKRFAAAGIKKFKSFVIDLTTAHSPPDSYRDTTRLPIAIGTSFDLIICDAPCSGSGTWSRTPEQLFYFQKSKIDHYASLQKRIVSNVIPHLKPGGYLLYITCSVFKKENEEAVEFIKKNFRLDVVKMELLKGYDRKADTMFASLLRKQL